MVFLSVFVFDIVHFKMAKPKCQNFNPQNAKRFRTLLCADPSLFFAFGLTFMFIVGHSAQK